MPSARVAAASPSAEPSLNFTVDGVAVTVPDDGGTLLGALRDHLGVRSAKDGCSPQGQCGCCTVLVDGAPRVSCVTPARRVAGRAITTVEGLDAHTDGCTTRWADAFSACGASQCGVCTPGIIVRLEGLHRRKPDADHGAVEQALAAHLCRCTGWQTIIEAWDLATADAAVPEPFAGRDRADAGRRATIEGGATQQVGPHVALGQGGFADDAAPADALVAVARQDGDGWEVGETLHEARSLAGRVQGRRTTASTEPPLTLPAGDWDLTLRTSWVEPAYVETDASWCEPGGEPATPLANGGAFGAKHSSEVTEVARRLADQHGRAVRVLLTREDVVRRGPKRPPIAAGLRVDGTGVLRIVRTPGAVDLLTELWPTLAVEEVDVAGPTTSLDVRSALWAELAVLRAALSGVAEISTPDGASATARVSDDGSIDVTVRCGQVLDSVVLRSYCIGAAHMALGWVTSESLTVDDRGEIHDLTIRSFGVPRATDMPPVRVAIEADDGPAVRGSDAVFAATALAIWRHQGLPSVWPTHTPLGT